MFHTLNVDTCSVSSIKFLWYMWQCYVLISKPLLCNRQIVPWIQYLVAVMLVESWRLSQNSCSIRTTLSMVAREIPNFFLGNPYITIANYDTQLKSLKSLLLVILKPQIVLIAGMNIYRFNFVSWFQRNKNMRDLTMFNV